MAELLELDRLTKPATDTLTFGSTLGWEDAPLLMIDDEDELEDDDFFDDEDEDEDYDDDVEDDELFDDDDEDDFDDDEDDFDDEE